MGQGYPCVFAQFYKMMGPQPVSYNNWREKMAKSVTKKATTKQPVKKRVRAKKADGTFQADDPSTPNVNEAFVQDKSPSMPDDQRVAQRSVGLRRLGGKLVG